MLPTINFIYFKWLAYILILFSLSINANAQDEQQNSGHNNANKDAPLIIGIFPRRNASTTIKLFTPIADYLSAKLNRTVKLETAKSFSSFWKKVILQRYDIVHFNQYHYIKTHDIDKYRAILQNEEFGEKTIAGSIVVRKDSGINSLQDLKNKKIIFGGGKKAMIAYVIPTALLHRAGLQNGDYIEQFSKNPPNSLLSVYYKQADAAGTGNIVLSLPTLRNSIDTSSMKYLISSESFAHLPWAVKTSMSETLISQIQDVLLKLNDDKEGQEILKKAKLTGLHIANDHDYDPYRKILIEVLGKNY
jgi:phosphonate transport system substrate-binding protein